MSSRRHFIHTVLGTSAAAAFAADSKLSYKGENIQFGLVTYMWGADWDLPTLLKNCETAQVLGVELRIDHAHKVSPSLTPEQRAAVRKQFEDSPVDLLGMGTNYEFHSPNVEEVKKNIEGAKQYIKLCHDLGGTGVKVKPNALPKDVPAEKTLTQIGKALAELGDYALGFGQEIRLEVHGKDTSELPNIKTIMDAANRDNVRVCWNSNDTDLNGAGLEANFALVKDHLGHTTHIRGVNQSSYPLDKLAKLLVEADYEGHVCLEAHKLPSGDRVAALAEQRELFMNLVTEARKSAKD
ncbi:sugar phosphate isomerase/epimerase family protein [Prosthecobacter vanneervenii]|uniref:Sugar phosphate isomerase/epimerase n=1 Tax=Prosthecobacter vanneervenii TaxID=48466 RepID=A0A7W7Y8W3_9BACT|nr:TIM barrel protein [Prosthecobacter vanneervenii]MBB5031660.1 sugar phosphate isomerase/epimerase [Prosthecobacter vanneervenii]